VSGLAPVWREQIALGYQSALEAHAMSNAYQAAPTVESIVETQNCISDLDQQWQEVDRCMSMICINLIRRKHRHHPSWSKVMVSHFTRLKARAAVWLLYACVVAGAGLAVAAVGACWRFAAYVVLT